MNISSGIQNSAIQDIVRGFSRSTDDVIYDIQREFDLNTGNFKNMASWDIRFNRIKLAADKHGLIVLTKRRAGWKYICILNPETGILYVFTREKNIDSVIKKFGGNKIHYFHAFVLLNGDQKELANQQLELFSPFSDEYEEKRLREVQKVLGEDYSSVNNIVFVVAQEEEKSIIGVEAQLYNRSFELVEVENWSQYVANVQYSDIINSEDSNETKQNRLLLNVKQSVKDRKEQQNKDLVKRKQVKDKRKEEGKS